MFVLATSRRVAVLFVCLSARGCEFGCLGDGGNSRHLEAGLWGKMCAASAYQPLIALLADAWPCGFMEAVVGIETYVARRTDGVQLEEAHKLTSVTHSDCLHPPQRLTAFCHVATMSPCYELAQVVQL